MKSHSDSLLLVVEGLLRDATLAYPHLAVGFERDYKRLALLVKDRGLGVFTLDLPSRDQTLLEGLESGRLTSDGVLKHSKKCAVPRLFAGLYLRIFDKQLNLKDNADVNAISILRQILCLGKKTAIPCSQKRKLKAIRDYLDLEKGLRVPNLNWDSDSLDYERSRDTSLEDDTNSTVRDLFSVLPRTLSRSHSLSKRCQRVADIVSQELGTFCLECHLTQQEEEHRVLGFKHGPGAVAERTGSYDKFEFQNWPAKLEGTFPYEMYGKVPSDSRLKPKNHEVPSRLLAVPKTAKGPRLIACEPSEHQWCQQAVRSWLEKRISSTFLGRAINFKRQDLSGEMALKASLDRKNATVDLSSASDRLTLWTVERMFRSNPSLLTALHAVRTRWLYIPDTGDSIKLKKFASQGTATTFPVQSLCFLICALTVSIRGEVTREKVRKACSQVRVFGDDIIIPKTGYADMECLLDHLQLKMNMDKSFVHGHFRESCGFDGYKGYDVTPTKPKTTISDGPASCMAVLDTLNNLFNKGYWNASEQLKRRLDRNRTTRFAIVGRGAGATGLESFSLRTALSRPSSPHWRNAKQGLDDVRGTGSCSRIPGYGREWESPNLLRSQVSGDKPEVLGLSIVKNGVCRSDRQLKIRFNTGLQRYEVQSPTILCRTTEWTPYSSGYSGILQGFTNPRPLLVRNRTGRDGIPGRQRVTVVRRWVDLQSMIGAS